jgi:hypothetical protein
MLKNKAWCILGLLPAITLAARLDTGIGGVADNLMNPVSVLSGFVSTTCLLMGGSFVFASLVKYMEHRRSPLMVPISTVIFLLIAGIALILLPLIYRWTAGGVPFWIFE